MADWLKWPEENLDYRFDFAERLDDGEVISSWTLLVPPGLTKGAEARTDSGITVWLEGGASGTYYEVQCLVTTNAGREMAEHALLYVR